MRKSKKKNIYISNEEVEKILERTNNASKLIEEALIFYDYAMKHNILYNQEINRIIKQKLL